jgi:hypothetical protein
METAGTNGAVASGDSNKAREEGAKSALASATKPVSAADSQAIIKPLFVERTGLSRWDVVWTDATLWFKQNLEHKRQMAKEAAEWDKDDEDDKGPGEPDEEEDRQEATAEPSLEELDATESLSGPFFIDITKPFYVFNRQAGPRYDPRYVKRVSNIKPKGTRHYQDYMYTDIPTEGWLGVKTEYED